MRTINHIVVHCSATKVSQKVTTADIDKWHKARGFRKIGYHYVIYQDGTIHKGREISEIGAHVTGNNSDSIAICYIGGIGSDGKPSDTRTSDQKASLFFLLQSLKESFPKAKICGHRDFSPDLNGNGVIEPQEWMKSCPSFDVKTEYKTL